VAEVNDTVAGRDLARLVEAGMLAAKANDAVVSTSQLRN
jgi:hypothetical protein